MKGLISLAGQTKGELEAVLTRADGYARHLEDRSAIEPVLKDVVVTSAFFEPSTRTKLSFDRAAKTLGATVLDFNPDLSSLVKGEALRDTLLTLEAMGTDILIVRHQDDDAAWLASDWMGVPVINAGAGKAEHPTQTLLDLLTLRRHFGELSGLGVGIVGDVKDSRVAAGLVDVLPLFEMDVHLIAPEEFLPEGSPVVELDEMLTDLDVVYLLRIQHERGALRPPRYMERFQMNADRARRLKETAVVMHPGPMNRGVELTDDVADSPRSLILEQVRNGVPTRMAVLDLVAENMS